MIFSPAAYSFSGPIICRIVALNGFSPLISIVKKTLRSTVWQPHDGYKLNCQLQLNSTGHVQLLYIICKEWNTLPTSDKEITYCLTSER